MKKSPFVMLALIVAVSLCGGGCSHRHTFSDQWSFDGTAHYHKATCGHDEVADSAAHDFGEAQIVTPATCTAEGKKVMECSVCGYQAEEAIPPSHSYVQKYDYAYHYTECTVCGDKIGYEAHDGNPCGTCGHTADYSALEFAENGPDAYQVKGMGDCTDAVVNIPAVYEGKPVTAIDGYAFKDAEFTQVNLPATITSIGIAAFMYCDHLEKINIPASVVSLGGNAFNGCAALNEIALPDTITAIGGFCFDGSGVYNKDENWTDNVLYIGKYAIQGKESTLSGPLEIREGTLGVATYAFSGCTHITEIKLPASVGFIGVGAFSECLDTTVMTVDGGNENYYAEGNCIVEKKAKRVVGGCPTSVILKDVKIIGESAFSGLEITEITIPVSVESIESYAFGFCDQLEDFNYEGTLDQWKQIALGTGWKSDTLSWWVIHCTDGFINPMGETKK